MSSQPTSPSGELAFGPARVRVPTPAEIAARSDWQAWYLTDEDDMGESPEQGAIIRLLLDLVERWVAECGWTDTFVGSDHFVGWVEGEDLVRISPDVFVIRDAGYSEPSEAPRSWQTWRPGHDAPHFAVEVVSLDWRKDYEELPLKYAQLGVDEYFVFDPAAETSRSRAERVPLQRFARADGFFVRTHAGAAPIWSDVLGIWLTPADAEGLLALRLARDPLGTDLVSTTAESLLVAEAQCAEAEAQCAEAEAQRAEAEAQRAEAEARAETEASARIEREAQIAVLEAELRRLRDGDA